MKIIFIDRDGVINKDLFAYVTSWERFTFLDGSLGALKKLTDSGYEIAIISNQAGVSKGDYSLEELNIINENMLKEIESVAGKRPSTYYCTHTDEDNCECRKPKLGLFHQAEKKLGRVDYKSTYYIGDQERDVEAAKNLGAKSILVLSGRTSREELNDFNIKPDYVKENLMDAVSLVLGESE